MWCSASLSWLRKPCSSAISCLQALWQWVWIHITRAHTHTHNPVCLIQWMFNGAEQPFILLCCLYLWQRAFKLCVCVFVLCICVWMCMYLLHQSDFKSPKSEPEMLLLSLFVHLWFQQLLFLVSSACSYVFSPHSSHKKYHSCSHPPASHLLFLSSDLCYISTIHLMLCVSCLLRYVMGWSCLCL